MAEQTEETPANYLTNINWKTLVEYMTAEAVFNRPTDPLLFCRDLLNAKIEERGEGASYNPQQATEWLKNCYAQATSKVDSNGIIRDKSNALIQSKSSSDLSGKIVELNRKLDGLQKLLDASSTIATLDPLQATDNIVAETCRILNCDRATIFTTDFITQELVLHVAEGASNIRVPLGKGIAGTVGATGETINLTDAYTDSRFNPVVDKATGYHTKTILCMPITSLDGRIVGVLQAINKNDDEIFSTSDEEVMRLLAVQAGIALQNANLYRNSESAREKFRSLLDIIRAMQGDMGINSLIFTITQRTIKVVDAERCTLYVCDNVSRGLFAMQGEVNIKISMAQGIAGHVATTGQILNIPDAYENPKFNQAIDKKTGFRTKAILCMPMKAEDNTVVGVLQLINKSSGSGFFTTEDEDVMNIFLSIAGPIFAASHLYAQMQGKGSNNKRAEEKMTATASVKHESGHAPAPRLSGFAEGEEEGEEEEEEIH